MDKGHEKCPVVSVSDEFTIDLANVVSESIEKNLKKKPHLVINHLNRTKLDPNRCIEIAAQTEDSKEAFKMYHGLIKSTTSKFKRGLLIDLHGRSKKDSITQLGYNIKKKQLLDNDFKKTELSIGTLAKENPEIDFLTGEFSFGDFMEKEGYISVPSPSLPKPDGNFKTLFYIIVSKF